MFKRLLLVTGYWLLVTVVVWANASSIISFQGRLTDASGVSITAATTVTFSIYNAASGGSLLWTSSSTTVAPDSNGFFSTTIDCSASGLDFNSNYWMEVSVGGTALSPRQQLTAAPYAAALTNGSKEVNGRLKVIGTITVESYVSGGTLNNPASVIYGKNTETNLAYYPSGVMGSCGNGNQGIGVRGQGFWGAFGQTTTGVGVYGYANGSGTAGVYGFNNSGNKGVYGNANKLSGIVYGVYGIARSSSGVGVCGSVETTGTGVYGYSSLGTGILGKSSTGYAGRFIGNVSIEGNTNVSGNLNVAGTITKGGGTFLIDHPLDPQNKVLRHSFVESPEMKNIYDGIVVLDSQGEALINLPGYFEALNKDFRYQLTTLGEYAPVYVKQEVHDNKFIIAGGRPGMKVSWQVTGVRHDAYAKEHPVVVEEAK